MQKQLCQEDERSQEKEIYEVEIVINVVLFTTHKHQLNIFILLNINCSSKFFEEVLYEIDRRIFFIHKYHNLV